MFRRLRSSAMAAPWRAALLLPIALLGLFSSLYAAHALVAHGPRSGAGRDRDAQGPGTGWAIILAADYQGKSGTIYKAVEKDAITTYKALITKLGYRPDRVLVLAEGPHIDSLRADPPSWYEDVETASRGSAQTINLVLENAPANGGKTRRFIDRFYKPNAGKQTTFPLYGEPTAENFLLARDVIGSLAESESTLMVVISAHGTDSGGNGAERRTFSVLPKGAAEGPQNVATRLQDTEILSFQTPARNRVFIVDACFADGLVSEATRILGTRSALPAKYARAAEEITESREKAGNAIVMLAASSGQAQVGESGSLFIGKLFNAVLEYNPKTARSDDPPFNYSRWIALTQNGVEADAPHTVGGPNLVGAEREAVTSSMKPSIHVSDSNLLETPVFGQEQEEDDNSPQKHMTVNRERKAERVTRRLEKLAPSLSNADLKPKLEQIIKHYREYGSMTNHEGMILEHLDKETANAHDLETIVTDMHNVVTHAALQPPTSFNDGLGDVAAVTIGSEGQSVIKLRNGVGSARNPDGNPAARAKKVYERFQSLLAVKDPWLIDICASKNDNGQWVVAAPGVKPQLVMADPEFAHRNHMNEKEFAPVLADRIRLGLDPGPHVVRGVVPPDAVAKMEEGSRYLKDGDFSRAEKSLKEAIAIHPDYPEAFLKLAFVYAKQPSPENRDKVRMCLRILREEVSQDLKPNDLSEHIQHLQDMIK